MARTEIPLSEVLPSPAGGVDTGKKPPEPPHGIGHHIEFAWCSEIKAVAIMPDFVVPTHQARAVLPDKYFRQDVVGSALRAFALTGATQRVRHGNGTSTPASCDYFADGGR